MPATCCRPAETTRGLVCVALLTRVSIPDQLIVNHTLVAYFFLFRLHL